MITVFKPSGQKKVGHPPCLGVGVGSGFVSGAGTGFLSGVGTGLGLGAGTASRVQPATISGPRQFRPQNSLNLQHPTKTPLQ